jgi:hypothetical protein
VGGGGGDDINQTSDDVGGGGGGWIRYKRWKCKKVGEDRKGMRKIKQIIGHR